MSPFVPNRARSLDAFPWLDHRTGQRRIPFLGSHVPLAHGPESRDSVLAKATGVLRRTAGRAPTVERFRPLFPRPLVPPVQLERRLGDRQARDADRLASQGFHVVLATEVSSGLPATSRGRSKAHCAGGAGEPDVGTGSPGS